MEHLGRITRESGDVSDWLTFCCLGLSGQSESLSNVIVYHKMIPHERIRGGGGPGGLDPPFVPRCRLFNIGPKIGPPSGPPFLLVDLIWTPPPLQKSWIRPCTFLKNIWAHAFVELVTTKLDLCWKYFCVHRSPTT